MTLRKKIAVQGLTCILCIPHIETYKGESNRCNTPKKGPSHLRRVRTPKGCQCRQVVRPAEKSAAAAAAAGALVRLGIWPPHRLRVLFQMCQAMIQYNSP